MRLAYYCDVNIQKSMGAGIKLQSLRLIYCSFIHLWSWVPARSHMLDSCHYLQRSRGAHLFSLNNMRRESWAWYLMEWPASACVLHFRPSRLTDGLCQMTENEAHFYSLALYLTTCASPFNRCFHRKIMVICVSPMALPSFCNTLLFTAKIKLHRSRSALVKNTRHSGFASRSINSISLRTVCWSGLCRRSTCAKVVRWFLAETILFRHHTGFLCWPDSL